MNDETNIYDVVVAALTHHKPEGFVYAEVAEGILFVTDPDPDCLAEAWILKAFPAVVRADSEALKLAASHG